MTATGAPPICALGYAPLRMAPPMLSLGFQPVCATFGRLGTASLYGSSYWWVACRCIMHIRHGRNQDVAHNMACFDLRKHNGHSHATPWACPVSRLDGSLVAPLRSGLPRILHRNDTCCPPLAPSHPHHEGYVGRNSWD